MPSTSSAHTHIRRRDDIVAIVAPKPLPIRPRRPRTMPHDEERIEPERSVQHDLALGCAEHSRQPPALARVHEEEDRIMCVDERFECRDVFLGLLNGRRRDWVARHRDGEVVARRVLQGVLSQLGHIG